MNVDEEESVYQEYFDDAQCALRNALIQNDENESRRQELAAYILELKQKTDSEGNALITIPSNFEKVAQAMNRSDLASNEKNSWSKYLLTQKFDEELASKFENGRYKNALNDSANEIKVQLGMASIHMLDNQLSSVSKRAHAINQELQSNSATPRTSRSQQDSTFMTRGKLDTSRSGASSRQESPNSSTMNSPAKLSIPDDTAFEPKDSNVGAEELITNNEATPAITTPNPYKKRITLTDDEAFRVEILLHDDYEAAISMQSQQNAYKERNQCVDNKLYMFGRLQERVLNVRDLDDDICKQHVIPAKKSVSFNTATNSSDLNYLSDQRKERAMKEYENKIEVLLKECASAECDYSAFLAPPLSEPRLDKVDDENNFNSHRHCLLDVPTFAEMQSHPRLLVTPQDIAQLVRECQAADASEAVTVPLPATSSSSTSSSSSSSALPLSVCAQGCQLSSSGLERWKIDRLLASLKSDIDKLSDLRQGQQQQSPGHSSHLNSGTAAGNDHDDKDDDDEAKLTGLMDAMDTNDRSYQPYAEDLDDANDDSDYGGGDDHIHHYDECDRAQEQSGLSAAAQQMIAAARRQGRASAAAASTEHIQQLLAAHATGGGPFILVPAPPVPVRAASAGAKATVSSPTAPSSSQPDVERSRSKAFKRANKEHRSSHHTSSNDHVNNDYDNDFNNNTRAPAPPSPLASHQTDAQPVKTKLKKSIRLSRDSRAQEQGQSQSQFHAQANVMTTRDVWGDCSRSNEPPASPHIHFRPDRVAPQQATDCGQSPHVKSLRKSRESQDSHASHTHDDQKYFDDIEDEHHDFVRLPPIAAARLNSGGSTGGNNSNRRRGDREKDKDFLDRSDATTPDTSRSTRSAKNNNSRTAKVLV